MMTDRLYVVTRRDLKRGLKIAQACHAALESPKNLLFISKEIPYLVVLEVKDEEALKVLLSKAIRRTVVTHFREPDLDNQLTAIAFLGNKDTKPLTKGLRLAG